MSDNPYTDRFYQSQSGSSLTAAEEILPIVIEHLQPKSIVDFGCGVGTWLAAARKLGIEDTTGLEGEWVKKENLSDPAIDFHNKDFEQPIDLGRKFDLAISMEVAEHLTEGAARQFVQSICAAADIVLFSAATPGQGGRSHKNEQWQSYWVDHFQDEGYTALDLVRPVVWNSTQVPRWYKQNALVYVRKESEAGRTFLEKAGETPPTLLDVIHPEEYRKRTSLRGGLGVVKRELLAAFGRNS
ncbi:MAG: methyltransferase domain-containing protein [Verrucomicrobiota bacterium]